MRSRVDDMPASSVEIWEWEEGLSRRLNVAHATVDEVRASTQTTLQVMRVEQKPQFWQLMDKRTWDVTYKLERSARHLDEMKEVVDGLEDIVIKMEGWTNSQVGKLMAYLHSFMRELRDLSKEITSKP